MTHDTYRIRGMHCASCASIIEKSLGKVAGVHTVEVNPGPENAKVSCDETKTGREQLSKVIEPLGYTLVVPTTAPSAEEMGMSASEHAAHLGLNQSKAEKLAELALMKTKILVVMPMAAVAAVIMAWTILIEFGRLPALSPVWSQSSNLLLAVMATYALFVVGKPYLLGFYRFLRYGAANMDTLIGIGTSAAYLYSVAVTFFSEALRPYINVEVTYFDVAIVVIAFITFGKYLEAGAKIKTGDAIEKLLNLQAKTALVLRDGREVEIPVDQ